MIQIIDIELLVPFENHPFKERSGIEQQELTESIKENGLLEPIIVRPFPANKYEIISGHRRVEACKALGITSIPVIIKQLTRDEAIVQMVDSNIHREHILPSEKAFAYKMKSEALKHQGKTSCQLGTKLRTDERIAENADDSADYRRDYEYRVRPSADFRYVRISENGHCGRGGGDSIWTDYGGTDCHEKRLSQIPAQTGLPTPHCQNLPAGYSEYSYAVGVYLLHTGIESDSCNLFRPGSNRTGTLL